MSAAKGSCLLQREVRPSDISVDFLAEQLQVVVQLRHSRYTPVSIAYGILRFALVVMLLTKKHCTRGCIEMGRYDWEEKQRHRNSLDDGSWSFGKRRSITTVAFLVLGGVGIVGIVAALLIPQRAPTEAAPAIAGVSHPTGDAILTRPLAVLAVNKFTSSTPAQGAVPENDKIALCGKLRITCVVDGDTFWFEGRKIRVADIDTPEISEPKCDSEYALGMRATQRFTELLNVGPFELQTIGNRDRDRYGRELRVVTRGGRSLGDQLVAEGLARTWTGRREPWC